MTHKSFTLISIALVVLLSSQSLSAQRTMAGQHFVSAEGISSLSSFGAGVYAGQYQNSGYWCAGASAVNTIAPTSSAEVSLDNLRIAASGAYLFRLLSTQNRVLSFYGGPGVLLGLSWIDPLKRKPYNFEIDGSIREFSFIYGASLDTCLEVFFCDTVAATLSARMPVCISAQNTALSLHVGLGLRINL